MAGNTSIKTVTISEDLKVITVVNKQYVDNQLKNAGKSHYLSVKGPAQNGKASIMTGQKERIQLQSELMYKLNRTPILR